MRIQPFVALVGILQVTGGFYSAFKGDWKMALCNLFLGFANGVFSTMH
jgi:hypothetical protein